MTPLARLRSFLRAVITRRRLDREMDAEMRFHLAERAADLVRDGVDRATAVRRAREEFGDPRRWREQGREVRGVRVLDQIGQDLRFGARWLRRSPAFTTAALLSVAIGIGANSAMFTLVDAVLLRFISVDHPESLVLVSRPHDVDGTGASFPYPFCRQLQDAGLSGADAFCLNRPSAPVINVDGAPEPVSAELVSGNYFDVLGVKPLIGRLIGPDDNRVVGGHPVIVLSFGFWQRRFASDPNVAGRSVRVNTRPMTIVGVTPPGFVGLEIGTSPDIRVPMVMDGEVNAGRSRAESRYDWWLTIVARVKPGVERAAAEAELQAAYQSYQAQLRDRTPDRLTFFDAAHGIRNLQSRFATPLRVLSGLAAAVLLLVCLNVANLMIARAVARKREFSIRQALGASRGRLVVQLVVEASLIVLVAAIVGQAIAIVGARTLARLALGGQAQMLSGLGLDARAVLFTSALAGAVAIVCGLAPLLAIRRVQITGGLGDDSRHVLGGRLLGRQVLVASQIAVSFALLGGAGLFTRTLANLHRIDAGFETGHLLLVDLNPAQVGHTQQTVAAFYEEVVASVSALPEVRSASLALMRLAGGGHWSSGLTLDTGPAPDDVETFRDSVGPNYFRTVGMTTVAGRDFDEGDTTTSQKVAIVNESFARRYLRGAALGRRIGPGGSNGSAAFTIVGVVRDSTYASLKEPVSPVWYVAYRQSSAPRQLTLHIRAAAPPDAALIAKVRKAVAAVDPRVTAFDVRTMSEQIADQLVRERLLAMMSNGCAFFAVLLAALGLYGVTAYVAQARTREFGLRLALGATPSALAGLMLRQTAILIAVGLAVGLVLAVSGAAALRPLLFGIDPFDPLTLAIAATAVGAISLIAAWLPTRHLTRIDPATTLH